MPPGCRIVWLCLAVAVVFGACGGPSTAGDFPRLTGPYVGQPPPGDKPVLFAPGLISTGMPVRDVAITPDGKEFFFGVNLGRESVTTILCTRETDAGWTPPEVAPFAADPTVDTIEPAISPDGRWFFFVSNRPALALSSAENNYDIWVMERDGDHWGEPVHVGPPVSTAAQEFFPSVTRDGTLYFCRAAADGRHYFFRSRREDGRYVTAERLGPRVNAAPTQFNAFIDPDERFFILCAFGLEHSRGATDYYVCFRDEHDRWTRPINLGPHINTASGNEFSPYVSPDGKYFFFMSTRTNQAGFLTEGRLTYAGIQRMFQQPGNGNSDIYWVRAGFIEALRPGAAAFAVDDPPPESGKEGRDAQE
ncbi:MAG: PD40 domain-containing protein [Acidobacteria bacterium]|nr:PD40 domain-containing protein [Acidobacteriota bacterium]